MDLVLPLRRSRHRPEPLGDPLHKGSRNLENSNRVALGSVLTLLYGLVLALEAKGRIFRFLVVIVVLIAVYLRVRSGGSRTSYC
jgi:hypothetical protein